MKSRYVIYALLLACAQRGMAQLNVNHTDSLAFKFSEAVSGESLERMSKTNVANSLFGQLKGLYTMKSTVFPNVLDDQATFNIRGISTFGNSAPLVLIDGIQRNIEALSMYEIEKVEVLKDAVASALYGVQGANGAILITTKRGKSGFHASADYQCSFDTPFRVPKFADAATYARLTNEALAFDGLPARYTETEIGYFADGTNRELYPDVDWTDMAYRDYGMTHQANVEFEGGSNKFRYYTSLSYGNTIGLLSNTKMFSQYNSQLNKINLNLRANIDAKLTETTTMRLNLLGRIKEQNRPGLGMEVIIPRIYNIPSAAFPVKTSSGKWGGTSIYPYNPVADIADMGTIKAIRRSLMADLTLNQKLDIITKGLYAEVTVAYDNMANYNDKRTRTYEMEMPLPIYGLNNEIIGVDRTVIGRKTELGWKSELNGQQMYVELKGKIGYSRYFGKNKVDAEIVYDQNSNRPNGQNATKKRQSVMAIVGYDFDNRYGVDAVVNYSGSAVLPDNDRFDVYPAVGLNWNASNEDFLKGNKYLTYLKIHASWGISGSDLFAHDLDRQIWGLKGGLYWFTNTNAQKTGVIEGPLPVVGLSPEKSMKTDLGFDLAFMNRLYLSATYFNEIRSNILVSGANVTSGVLGLAAPRECVGKVKNQGVEVGLNYADNIGKFNYSIGGNFTYAKNEILNNNEGFQPEDYLYQTGSSLNQFYGLESDGFFNSQEDINKSEALQTYGALSPGDVRYVDQNHDKIINQYDVVRLGYSQLPEIYYGFNVGLEYKGWSLNADFQGVANRSIYLDTPSVFMPLKNNTNISTWYLEDKVRWTPETIETANVPRLTTVDNPNNFQKSDIWMANGNFLKLRDLELAYTLNRSLLKKVDLKIFLRGTNLFSFDSLGYADPENYGAAYPSMRSYTAGVNLIF